MGIDIDDPDIMNDEYEEALLELSLHYNERSTISRKEEEVFKSIYSLPLTEINESIQIDVCSTDLEDNVQQVALTLFQEQLGEE